LATGNNNSSTLKNTMKKIIAILLIFCSFVASAQIAPIEFRPRVTFDTTVQVLGPLRIPLSLSSALGLNDSGSIAYRSGSLYFWNGTSWNPATSTYSLPTASTSVLGGVKIGTDFSIVSGVLNAHPNVVTAGSVPYLNGSGVMVEDNTGLSYDGNNLIVGHSGFSNTVGLLLNGGRASILASGFGMTLTMQGGIPVDASKNFRVINSQYEYIHGFTTGSGYADWKHYMDVETNFRVRNMSVDSTAPAIRGTPQMVVTDRDGQFSFQTIPSGGGGGISSLSVAGANGISGSSSGGATPVITITTPLSGIIKGNGTGFLAATAGTDYLTPTGSAAGLTSFPTLNQNTTGNAGTVTNGIYSTGSYTNPSWLISIPYSKVTSTPTTISGWGITDYNSLGDARWSLLSHTHAFVTLTSIPTTIGGYGITDYNSLGDARWAKLSGGNTFSGDQILSGGLKMTTTTKAFVPPTVTTAQMLAITSPDDGSLVNNSDSARLIRYNASLGVWRQLSSTWGNIDPYINLNQVTRNIEARQTGLDSLIGGVSVALTSGSTYTVGNMERTINYNPSTTTASLAVTFPPTPKENQTITFTFGGAITYNQPVVTALSFVANSGQSLNFYLIPTFANSITSYFTFKYTNSTWIRL
jgi:hypothetical protein